MKIALVEFAAKGGLIHYAYQLGRALNSAGAEVTLITDGNYELDLLPQPFHLDAGLRLWDPKPQQDGAGKFARRMRRGARAATYYREWIRLVRRLRALNPDVVQFGDIRFATDVAPLALVRRGRWLLGDVCHNVAPFGGGEGSSGTFGMSAFERRLYTRTYSLFDAIFVHYDINVAAFAASFPQSASRVTRIVHGNEEIFGELADPELTAADVRRAAGVEPSQHMLLFFGTLSPYKGLDLLLEAFAAVAHRVPGAVLVVAGHEGPGFYREEFLRRGSQLGVADRIRLVTGYVDSAAVRAWMEAADAVVFPYRNVYQSGALHVAQTFGAPIVATRVGAMTEVIRDGETGVLVESEAAAIAEGCVQLLLDRDRARFLGAAAANDAARRFSWSGVATTMLDRYDALLRGRR